VRGDAVNARLIACNVPAGDPVASQQFYSTLLGFNGLARSFNEKVEGYHAPLNNEGQWLWVSQRHVPEEQITCVFGVDDLAQATNELTAAGATQFGNTIDAGPLSPKLKGDWSQHAAPNVAVTDSLGKLAYFKDPDGNVIALMEVAAQAAPSFGVGKYRNGLNGQVRKSFEKARIAGKKIEHH
jgi:predicted enzyme related to lactoylglutathione lyase